MMAFNWPRVADYVSCAILLATFCNLLVAAAGQQQQAPVAKEQPRKILIPDLPPSHYQFWLKNSPTALQSFERICDEVASRGTDDIQFFEQLATNFTFEDHRSTTNDYIAFRKRILDTICSKINVVRKSCWGYEKNCEIIYLMPECSSSDSQSEQAKKIEWFSQADFGYILDRRNELSRYCAPDKYSNHSIKSSLECTKHFRTCRGQNLYLKFTDSQSVGRLDGPLMIEKGQVGGWNCDLQSKRIEEESTQSGFLRSWFNELKHYNKLDYLEPTKACEKRIDKQVYFVQLDSTADMYHYFCNFINLYATMHLNNRFSEDNQIIFWDKKLPNSQFEDMWSVFSKNKPTSLDAFKNTQVCFDKVVFTMPPRMIHGLYYNTPLVEGCSKSGLFDAFNKHVLHKLGIHGPREHDQSSIRVTIVSTAMPTRRILNEVDLKTAADSISNEFQTRIVDLANMTFLEQLKIVQNTDILVGVHEAVLTHTLFLPDWAALFELYDRNDERYRDLARLRGVSYFTLEGEQNSGQKFDNSKVDVKLFVETLKSAAEVVKRRLVKLAQDSAFKSEPEPLEAVKDLGVTELKAEPETEKVEPEENQKDIEEELESSEDSERGEAEKISPKKEDQSETKPIDLGIESQKNEAASESGRVEEASEIFTEEGEKKQGNAESKAEPPNEEVVDVGAKIKYAEVSTQANKTGAGPRIDEIVDDSNKTRIDTKMNETVLESLVDKREPEKVKLDQESKQSETFVESRRAEGNDKKNEFNKRPLKSGLLGNRRKRKMVEKKSQNEPLEKEARTIDSTVKESKPEQPQHTEL